MRKTILALALIAAAFSASAQAAPTTLTLNGFEYAPGVTGSVKFNGKTDSDIGVGALNATYDDGTGFGGQSFLAFCVDLAHNAAPFGTAANYTAYPNFQSTLDVPYTMLGKLFTYNDSINGGVVGDGLKSANIRDSAAMQLAVWELVYDNNPGSVNKGNFKAISPSLLQNGIATMANSLIAGALATTTSMYDITYLSDDTASKAGFQNFVTGTYDSNLGIGNEPPVAAVPEPETYALMLAGLGAMGFVARRRKSIDTK